MRHANSETSSFVTTTIGHAAGFDAATGTRFRKFVPGESDEPIEEAAE
jgi:hypothetical protein